MAESPGTGFFLMPRGWQDHPALSDKSFSKAQAWVWLVEEARWKPAKISIAGKTVELQRGELSHSIRFLAERWGWGKGVVERFIGRLKTETMIETRAETGQLIISIRNYDEMQAAPYEIGTASETPAETLAGQQRDSSGTKKKESKTRKERNRLSSNLDFEAWWEAFPRKVGKGKARPAYEAALKKATATVLLEACRKHAAACIGQDLKFTPHPATWLTGERWLDGEDRPASGQSEIVFDETLKPLLPTLQRTFEQPVLRSWFREVVITSQNSQRIEFQAPSKFLADHIRQNYGGQLDQSLGRGRWSIAHRAVA